jgi:hypothetical protein
MIGKMPNIPHAARSDAVPVRQSDCADLTRRCSAEELDNERDADGGALQMLTISADFRLGPSRWELGTLLAKKSNVLQRITGVTVLTTVHTQPTRNHSLV